MGIGSTANWFSTSECLPYGTHIPFSFMLLYQRHAYGATILSYPGLGYVPPLLTLVATLPLGVEQQDDLRIGIHYRRAGPGWARWAGATIRVMMPLARGYSLPRFQKRTCFTKLACLMAKGCVQLSLMLPILGWTWKRIAGIYKKALIWSNTTGLRAGSRIPNTLLELGTRRSFH